MNPTASDVVEEASAWALGGGLITFTLFPLALPILLLTVAFVLPFALAGLAIAMVVAVARISTAAVSAIALAPPRH